MRGLDLNLRVRTGRTGVFGLFSGLVRRSLLVLALMARSGDPCNDDCHALRSRDEFVHVRMTGRDGIDGNEIFDFLDGDYAR